MKTVVMKPKKLDTLPKLRDKFIYEWKYDGGSCVIEKQGNRTSIFHSDNATNVSYKYPELIKDINNSVKDGTYIAELCVVSPRFVGGAFPLFLKRQCENSFKIQQRSKQYPITAMTYDIVSDGLENLCNDSLLDRKKMLEMNVKEAKHIKLVKYFTKPDSILKMKDTLEGIVIKDINTPYRFNRRDGWFKYRFNKEEVVRCVRFEDHPVGIVLFTEDNKKFNLPGPRAELAKRIIKDNGFVDTEISYQSKSDKGFRFAVVKRVLEK